VSATLTKLRVLRAASSKTNERTHKQILRPLEITVAGLLLHHRRRVIRRFETLCERALFTTGTTNAGLSLCAWDFGMKIQMTNAGRQDFLVSLSPACVFAL
jgi:hypothetical protein